MNLSYVIIIIIATIFMTVSIARCADVSEPVYNGYSATEWVKKGYFTINRPMSDPRLVIWPEEAEANQAVRKIGAKAVPTFLRLLEDTNGNDKFPGSDSWMRREYGGWGLSILGTNAVAAIPALKGLLERGNDDQERDSALASYNDDQKRVAAMVLYNMGFQGIAPLAEVLADHNAAGRSIVAYNLGNYADPDIPWSADKIKSQQEIDAEGRVIVPILMRYVHDQDKEVRMWALCGLGKFAQQPELVVPALIGAVSDTNKMIQVVAIQALGNFGQNATKAIPILENKVDDEDPGLRLAAVTVLERIRAKH